MNVYFSLALIAVIPVIVSLILYSKRENTPSIAVGFHRMGGDESRFIF